MHKMLNRFFLLFLVVLVACLFLNDTANATVWMNANTVILHWSETTKLQNGNPIPDTDTIKYKAAYYPAASDPLISKVEFPETSSLQQSITFPTEGNFFVGVMALRYRHNELLSTGAWSWSSDPLSMQSGQSEGVMFYFRPTNPYDLLFK